MLWVLNMKYCNYARNVLQLLNYISISRYDTQRHDLTDYTSARDEVFPGQDYSNPRIKDFYKGKIVN